MTILRICEAIAQDAVDDARKTDSTPFSPAGVGTNFGQVYASLQALANICADQQRQIDAQARRIAQLTDEERGL